MTTDNRKIQLEAVVDSTGAKQGFQQVKDGAKDMAQSVAQAGQQAAKGLGGIGDGAGAAAAKVDRATSNLIGSIQRATAATEAGRKSGADFFESLAKQRDIPIDTLKPFLDQLRAVEAQAKATAAATRTIVSAPALTTSLGASSFVKPLGSPTTSLGATSFGQVAADAQKAQAVASASLDKIGISAKQTAAALRGVPAQFTDIVTSIQGGQAPLTVLLQQGGQLKDMFGGIGPAAKALGGYVLGLINPFTVAAAAVGTLGLAYFQGAKESQEYNKALILTGNYLGLTVTQLQGYAKAISGTVGTQGAAAEALTALANSGKVASESLTAVGTAVVLMNRVLGQSVDEATATFVKLADEPTKASVKLNEAMHYLNLATYERIRALEEQGNKEAAAALAQKTLAEATVERLKSVESQAGILSKTWRVLTDDAKWAWDAMLGIGRTKSVGEALSDAQKKVEFLRQFGSTPRALAAAQDEVNNISRKALREQENAFASGEKARTEAARIGASDRLKTLSDEVRTNADKRKKAIQDLNNDFKTLGKPLSGSEYDKLVSNINDKFKDPKGAAPKAFQDDAATKMLETLRQQEAALKEQLSTDEKLTASEKERAKFVQLVSDLKTKGTLTAEQKSLLLAQDSIKAQLDKNVALEDEVKAREKATKEAERLAQLDKQFGERSRQRTEAIASSLDSQNDQYDRIRATFGLGDRARAEVEAQRSIFREYNKMQLDLVKNTPEHLLGSDKFQEESQKIKDGLNTALDAQKQFYTDEKAARENWINGATSALANYIDEIDNAAARSKALVTDTLGGITDGITGLLMGEKGSSFKDLGKKIATQITRGFVEQEFTKPLAQWLQGGLKDGDSIVSKLLGGAVGGKGTGLLDSLLGNKPSEKGGDALGDFLKGKGLLGDTGAASAAAATASLATGATAATAAITALASAAASAAAAMGGSSVSGLSGLGNLFSGGSSSSGGDALGAFIQLNGFANGGEPPVGRVSIVGERGPELFVPKQAGTVIPNDQIGALGGRSNVFHIQYVAQPGESRKTASQNGRAFADQASRFKQRDS